MRGTARQRVNQLPVALRQFGDLIVTLADRLGNRNNTSPGLAIKAGGSAVVKAGSAFDALLNGTIVNKAANTDMAALVGTVTNAKHNVFYFFLDVAGNLTSAMGTEGASISAVIPPPVPAEQACIGYVRINPTGTGNFVGGTTALDDGTVVPNAVYVNITGPYDPTILPA